MAGGPQISNHQEKIGQKIDAAFAQAGQRASGPRRLITDHLVQLAGSGQGFTADELWQRLKTINLSIGRATVFRSIRSLVELSILDCIERIDGVRLYRVCGEGIFEGQDHHHHLVCTGCHRIVEFHYCLPTNQLDQIGEQEHFKIAKHTLTIYGRCQDCA
jgi:Fur family ferric uptake transcriptional regulator